MGSPESWLCGYVGYFTDSIITNFLTHGVSRLRSVGSFREMGERTGDVPWFFHGFARRCDRGQRRIRMLGAG